MLNEIPGDDAGVVAGAAGDDVHAFGTTEYLGRSRTKGRFEQPAIRDPFLQGIGHCSGLFEDFLEHEVPVGALLRGIGRQLALARRAFGMFAFAVDDAHALARHLSHIAFFEENKPPGDGQQRADVGSNVVLAGAEADNGGTAHARDDDAVRVLLADHGECVGALEFGDGSAHRPEQVAEQRHVIVDAVRHHLGVGLGFEHVARRLQLRAQLFVILDDAVVDDGEAVARNMRVRVAFAGNTVRGPACVGNAKVTGNGVRGQFVLEGAHLADGAPSPHVAVGGQHGDARGIIAAVFEALEAVDQQRHHVAPGDRPDYSAHASFLLPPLTSWPAVASVRPCAEWCVPG